MSDTAWTAADIAAQQRKLVDEQLDAMRKGVPPAHFGVIDDVLKWLSYDDDSMTLLDAGCASGYYHEIIEHYCPGRYIYTGLDFNHELLAMAKEHYPHLSLIERDLRATGLDAQSYDIVLSGACLMHIRDWRDALGELTKIARRWLILHRTWVVDGETQITTGDAYGHTAWYIRFEEAELFEIVQAAGFKLAKRWDNVEAGTGCNVNTYLFERTQS